MSARNFVSSSVRDNAGGNVVLIEAVLCLRRAL
jgi:hypothetical protein